MANINISLNTTAKQDVKLARMLASVNITRVSQGLSEFASVEDYFRFMLVESVKQWVAQQTAADAKTVGEIYEAASDSVKAQVQALLNM